MQRLWMKEFPEEEEGQIKIEWKEYGEFMNRKLFYARIRNECASDTFHLIMAYPLTLTHTNPVAPLLLKFPSIIIIKIMNREHSRV